jgi:hypothetical protein
MPGQCSVLFTEASMPYDSELLCSFVLTEVIDIYYSVVLEMDGMTRSEYYRDTASDVTLAPVICEAL